MGLLPWWLDKLRQRNGGRGIEKEGRGGEGSKKKKEEEERVIKRDEAYIITLYRIK